MRTPSLLVFGLAALFAPGCDASKPAPEPTRESTAAAPGYAAIGATPCEPVGEIRFICGLVSAEDLATLPGAQWIIASGNREGGRLHLVSVRDKTATVLFPAPRETSGLTPRPIRHAQVP